MKNEITIEQTGYGQWKVCLTFKNIRYKYYCTDSQLIDEFKNRSGNEEKKQKEATKWLKTLCRLQGKKQIGKIKWWSTSQRDWKDEK